MKIIVTGSLGNIGRPLMEELIAKGHEVSVVSSKPEKKAEIENAGATAAIGSVDDAEFLTATFAGANAVYLMIPPNYTAPDAREYYRKIGNSYAEAVRRARVERIVHLSSYGAHLDHGTGFILGSHDVEEILNQLDGVSVTHLRPGYFYYNLFSFVPMIKDAGFIGTNYGGNDLIVLADPLDIAEAAAEELTASRGTGTMVRYIASDERTADEIARVLGAAIGRPDLKWVTFTDQQTQDAIEAGGVPSHVAVNLVEIGSAIHSGALRGDYDQHKPERMSKIKLEDFAQRFAAAFSTI